MIRRLSLLGGLAIIAVVCNHAVQWSFIVSAWGADPAQALVPDYQRVGWVTYYILLTIEKLAVFSVPAFLFISGFFVAYAARGPQSTLSWKAAATRVGTLLPPYVLWSLVVFAISAVEGNTTTPIRYILLLFSGGAIPAFFFVPLLCQFYLLSPLLVPVAKTNHRFFLLAAALVQLMTMSVIYVSLYVNTPITNFAQWIVRHWSLFPLWAFFFALGLVAGFRVDALKSGLTRFRAWLLVATAFLGLMMILEADVAFRYANVNWRDSPITLPSSLYAISFILCFLASDDVRFPFPRFFNYLSSRTFGIYLIHAKVIVLSVPLVATILPFALHHPALLQPVLIGLGLGVPLLLMELTARTPARKFYRYIFG